jgi:acyl-[acyl-carrier-protein] desaturase
MRHDHSEKFMAIIEGFFAVEQYAPDYTVELTRLARRGFGHSQFQIAWGAEEAKHADLWRNVLLLGRARTPVQLEDFTGDLRASAWEAPFDSPLEMLFYTVFQERATQLIYLKTAALVRGGRNGDEVAARDDVLARAIATIAKDEAAHYDFFLALARLHLYYFPQEALEALVNVVRNFVMPASKIVPNYDSFIAALYEARLFGPSMYGREVARPALAALGIESVKAVEAGIARSRCAPALNGESLRTPPPEVCDFRVLESSLTALFDRVHRYESEVGLTDVDPTEFTRVPW